MFFIKKVVEEKNAGLPKRLKKIYRISQDSGVAIVHARVIYFIVHHQTSMESSIPWI